ncbi:MAG TPA: amidohydrolase family protein [Chthonomonadaceae bacterium]|nr:amidohydrolase family protein [Chthonomonadaceae bacterium]
MRICGKHIDTGEVVTVDVEAGRIAAIVPGEHAADLGAPDLWLAPGLCDVQLNGYAGRDFNIAVWGRQGGIEQALREIRGLLARTGTALFCPTITTNSREAICESLAAVARALDADPALARSVPGIHVEGPFIAPEDGPRGAHPLEHVRDPDWDEFQAWQEAAGGRIKIHTLAPERPGALPFIERLAAAGVVVAIGHTAAEPEEIRAAVAAAATMSTHLGNGAHSMLRRHPNYIWEQLADDRLVASVIADGHHLPPSVVKCIARVKGPDRLVLVSDAVSLGGLPPGLYTEGRHEVHASGKITLAGTPYLAGAGHLLDTCVANALRFTDLTLAQCVSCATANPARLLGLADRKGRLAPGYDADLTLFRLPDEGPLEVAATLCGGERVE